MFFKIKLIFIALCCFALNGFAQPAFIVNTKLQYDSSVMADGKNALVNLSKLIPTIILDLKYGTTKNFTHKKLYKNARTTYLRYDAAMALLQIQQSLISKGYTIKIFDAYRPYSVTKLMWALIQDERYVANPKNGSGHNKGTSIDLTIVKLANNEALNMGTDFDNFTEMAHHSYTANFDSTIRANRNLLKETMEKFGFKSSDTEWWHYSFVSNEKYDVIDLSFKKLKNIMKN